MVAYKRWSHREVPLCRQQKLTFILNFMVSNFQNHLRDTLTSVKKIECCKLYFVEWG